MTNIIKAIQKIYPDIEGGFVFWETKSDGKLFTNPIYGLRWNNTKYKKPSWSDIEVALSSIELQEAIDKKKKEINKERDDALSKSILFVQDNKDHYLSRDIRSELSWMRKKKHSSPWITDDNVIISITLKEFDSINGDLSDRDDPVCMQARLRKDAIIAIKPSKIKTIEQAIKEVEDYDITKVSID